MENYTTFIPQASLAAFGAYFRKQHLWEQVEKTVHISQKTVQNSPTEKLLDGLIAIWAGGQRLVEVNQLVRAYPGLQCAFGRQRCAEQSVISQTLNCCTPENVTQLRQVNTVLIRRYSQAYRHNYAAGCLVLECDEMGMPAGRQGVEKAHFSEQKYRRGRQLARVTASQYDEVIYDRLYAGKVLLEKNLIEVIAAAEQVLELTPLKRGRCVIRIDGGGGTDQNLNWLLAHGYQVVAKVKNYNRSRKLCRSVRHWIPDPQDPSRQMGWIPQPHAYARPTCQIGIRYQQGEGRDHDRVLVLPQDPALWFWLAGWPMPPQPTELELLEAAMQAYSLRGGGVETANQNSQLGLGICKRNIRLFAAQEMLVLLAQLAYNLFTWFRRHLGAHLPALHRVGWFRLLRDWLQIDGILAFVDDQLEVICFNQAHPRARPFVEAYTAAFGNDLLFILDKI